MRSIAPTGSSRPETPPHTGPDQGIWVLIVVFALALLVLFKPWVHGFDTVGYYSWLRSIVVDGDLEVGDEFIHYGYGDKRGQTITGYTYNEYAVGSAVLWLPFFLIAHAVALCGQAAGLSFVPDGYGAPYVWAVGLGSTLYGLGAVLLSYRLCRLYWNVRVSLLATLAIWFSSPLVFYMYSHPLMSHADDAFACALLLFTWQHTRKDRSYRSALARGATAGLCALVRQMNATWALILLAEAVTEIWTAWQRGAAKPSLAKVILWLASFAAAWWLIYLPQVIVWRIVFGRWIVLNPYAEAMGGRFIWSRPHILDVLFSTNRGLLIWTPLLLPAAFGWLLIGRKEARLAALVTAQFVLQLYVVSSWPWWSGGTSFGPRFFTNMYAAFVLGLGALVDRAQQALRFRWAVFVCFLSVAWNLLLLVRYALEDVPRKGAVPLAKLIGGQFTVLPRYLPRILDIIIRRS